MGRVECYSGGEYAERPRALFWQGERLEVESVLAQWKFPNGKAFKVRTKDNRAFELRYDKTTDEWDLSELS
jgi:hypothetical protein